jgi:hypothetical protein
MRRCRDFAFRNPYMTKYKKIRFNFGMLSMARDNTIIITGFKFNKELMVWD